MGGQCSQTTSKKAKPTDKASYPPHPLSLPSCPASEWVPVNARPLMVTQQTMRNLALGDKFFLRVTAVSRVGAGPPAVLEQPVHILETIGKAPRHLAAQLSPAGEASPPRHTHTHLLVGRSCFPGSQGPLELSGPSLGEGLCHGHQQKLQVPGTQVR